MLVRFEFNFPIKKTTLWILYCNSTRIPKLSYGIHTTKSQDCIQTVSQQALRSEGCVNLPTSKGDIVVSNSTEKLNDSR